MNDASSYAQCTGSGVVSSTIPHEECRCVVPFLMVHSHIRWDGM